MIGNYLIGFREGIEASLIVSILITYLVRTQREFLIRFVWVGVLGAIIVSAAVAGVLQGISTELSDHTEPIFAGTMSCVAVGFVTWMIFWMKRSAKTIAGELRGRLDTAALAGGAVAVASMAFFAVVREGTETAVFFWAAAHATGHQGASFVGLLLGLVTAAFIGFLVFKSSAKINLRTLFNVTGVALVFVAAGVLSYGIAEFQEVGLLTIGTGTALNLSSYLTDGSVQAVLAAGLFNLKAITSTLQVAAYLVYVIVVLSLILRPSRSSLTSTPVPDRTTV